MKLARSRRRAFCAFAGLAAAYAAPALAYDDKSTISSVMDLVGVSTERDAKSIDYSERPKLVLPPNISALPEPRESADRPGGWPSNAPGARRQSDRFARAPNAQPEEKQPGLLERALAGGSSSGSSVSLNNEPSRRLLTEPPSGYRRPTQDLSKVRDTDAKKGSWWNPMTYLGGGDPGAAAPAQAVQPQTAPAQQKQQASAESEGFLSYFRMPRFVVRDPNKE